MFRHQLARTRVRPKGIGMIVRLLERVAIVGINALHPFWHKKFDEAFAKRSPSRVVTAPLGGT